MLHCVTPRPSVQYLTVICAIQYFLYIWQYGIFLLHFIIYLLYCYRLLFLYAVEFTHCRTNKAFLNLKLNIVYSDEDHLSCTICMEAAIKVKVCPSRETINTAPSSSWSVWLGPQWISWQRHSPTFLTVILKAVVRTAWQRICVCFRGSPKRNMCSQFITGGNLSSVFPSLSHFLGLSASNTKTSTQCAFSPADAGLAPLKCTLSWTFLLSTVNTGIEWFAEDVGYTLEMPSFCAVKELPICYE